MEGGRAIGRLLLLTSFHDSDGPRIQRPSPQAITARDCAGKGMARESLEETRMKAKGNSADPLSMDSCPAWIASGFVLVYSRHSRAMLFCLSNFQQSRQRMQSENAPYIERRSVPVRPSAANLLLSLP
jgi:hypothetical protein